MFWTAFVWGLGATVGGSIGLMCFVLMFAAFKSISESKAVKAAEQYYDESLKALLLRNEIGQQQANHLEACARTLTVMRGHLSQLCGPFPLRILMHGQRRSLDHELFAGEITAEEARALAEGKELERPVSGRFTQTIVPIAKSGLKEYHLAVNQTSYELLKRKGFEVVGSCPPNDERSERMLVKW